MTRGRLYRSCVCGVAPVLVGWGINVFYLGGVQFLCLLQGSCPGFLLCLNGLSWCGHNGVLYSLRAAGATTLEDGRKLKVKSWL